MLFYVFIATFARRKHRFLEYADIKILEHSRALHHTDGALVRASRADAYVPKTIRERDVITRSRFHRYRIAHLVLHRSSDMHTDETQHTKPMDAPMGVGLHHT